MQQLLRVWSSTCPDGIVGSKVLMNSRYFVPIAVVVSNTLALCANRLVRLHGRGVTDLEDYLDELTPLGFFPVAVLVEDSAHLLRINSMYPIGWRLGHGD